MYESIILVAVLLFTGALAGLGAGLLGIGGGIVIVPVLNELFNYLDFGEHSMHLAIATSLSAIIPTSISSVRAHIKKGSFDKALFKSWYPFLFMGALIGGFLAAFINGDVLRLFFGIVMSTLAINMLKTNTITISDTLPKNPIIHKSIPSCIGFISSWLGVGGGALSVPIFKLFSVDMHKAVGTASGFGLVIAIPACIGFIYSGFGIADLPPFSIGYVNMLGFVAIVCMSIFFAPLGAKLAHKLDANRLKRVFALFLIAVGIKMIIGV